MRIGVKEQSEKDDPTLIVSGFIREESRRGRLVSRSEVLQRLHAAGGRTGKEPLEEDGEKFLQRFLQGSEDVQELRAPNGAAHYFSTIAMTGHYARILIGRRGDPLALMAEIVRESSALYPRPVPVDSFMESPFEMTEDEIEACLARIPGQEDMQDIRPTTTSSGALFLFSTRHLEPDHAAMLAEWLDVGSLTDP